MGIERSRDRDDLVLKGMVILFSDGFAVPGSGPYASTLEFMDSLSWS